MKSISNEKQIGRLIKAVRKQQQLTQKDLAGACGTGVRFIQELEKGKETSEMGKVLRVLKMLGIKVLLKLPDALTGSKNGLG